MSLVEIAPNRWVVEKRRIGVQRSNLPLPFVISDEMPPVEQVDGKYYTSKAAFRAVGRANGLTEVGNEKLSPKTRTSAFQTHMRRNALQTAREKYKAGYRARSG